MKKILFGLVAAAGMLFATSCAKDVDGVGVPSGGDAAVTFKVGLENGISTRAISDGSGATNLTYMLFDTEDTDSNTGVYKKTATLVGGTTTIKLDELVKGNNYKVVFWAQSETAPYDLENFPTVTYDAQKKLVANDDSYDAFCAVVDFTVDDAPAKVVLNRPFAQINLGLDFANSAATEVAKSSIAVTGAYTGIDLYNNAMIGDGDEPIEFESNAIPGGNLTITGKDNTYTYMAMCYVFVDGSNVDVDYELHSASDGTIDKNTVYGVRVAVNYRTNLYGTFTTNSVEMEVEVTPGFTGDDNQDIDDEEEEPQPEEKITVSAVSVEYKSGTVELMATLSIPEGQEVNEAWFVCTPEAAGAALARAVEGVVRIPAEVEGDMISKTGSPDELGLTAGVKYIVTVELDGQSYDAPAGDSADNVLDIPEDKGDEPEPDPEVEAGTTPEKPFTVAEAIAKAEETGKTATSDNYYVKGVVSSVTEQFGSYGNATFVLIDKGTPEKTFEVYRAKYLNNQNGVEGTDTVNAGDEVIVCGKIINYNENKPQLNTGGYIYEFVSYAPTVSDVTVTVADDGKITFKANYTNKSNVAITKAGFKYGEQEVSAEIPTGTEGEITATLGNLEYNTYVVKAFLNDIESKEVIFRHQDPNEEKKEVTYTASWEKYGKNGGNSGYDKDCTMTMDDIDWVLEGNSQINPWRLGGKSITATDRAFYSKTAIAENVNEINVKHGTANLTVNSFKVIVSKNADFSSPIYENSYSFNASTTTTVLNDGQDWSNCYFKFVYNVTNSTSSNQYVQLVEVQIIGK